MITTPLYRMYDKVNKRYREGSYYLSKSGERFVWRCGGRDKIPTGEDYVIERCTGIQDINGNRMYEGDIVTFGLDYKDIKYTLVYEGMQWKISDGANLKFVTDGKDLEVVGNIHS